MDNNVRRLIEVDLPIAAISQHALRDRTSRRGHLHTLHVWWAKRALAGCRAVLMATLLPDPADERCPQAFRVEAHDALGWVASRDLSDPMALRQALLDFIAHFAAADSSTNARFVETARRLVRVAHPDGIPVVVDPFGGMGSIPFEALRIGAGAFASDYNPVATLLLKTALEYLPTYGDRLAEAVRQWGDWVRQRAAQHLHEFYPLEPDGSIPLAYLWARTIRCEGPACGAEIPLVGLLWLSRKAEGRVALRYRGDSKNKRVVFEICQPNSEDDVQTPIVRKFIATCPVCGYTTPYKRVREQLTAKHGGTRDARMIAVITLKPHGGRGFRLADYEDLKVAQRATRALHHLQAQHHGPVPLVPDEPLPPDGTLGFRVNKYGMQTWGDLFAPRQALALTTFVGAVQAAHQQLLAETGDAAFARAVATCVALSVSNMAQYFCATAFYIPEYIRSPYYGSAFPMSPDFADVNPFVPAAVGPAYETSLAAVEAVIAQHAPLMKTVGTSHQGSATAIPMPDDSVPYVITDPPYYDAVPYAALSDLCYVWLRRMLHSLYPDLFRSILTPKVEECIEDPGPAPPGAPKKDKAFFETTMERALTECRRVLQPNGLAVVLFAHKGTAGWEALLNALVAAGWTVTASWPIEMERRARMRARDSAVLATSVFLVCRTRSEDAPVGEWRQVLSDLNQRVAEWLPRLEQEGIQGADAVFSCLGPALQVYSQYDRVETAAGQVVPLGDVKNGRGQIVQRGYLSYVWEAVAREALKVIFPEADPSGFEEDARLTAMWLWTVRGKLNAASAAVLEEASDDGEEKADRKGTKGYTLPYDDARLIIQGLGVREDRLKGPGRVLEVKGGKARLLAAAERRRSLLGDDRVAGRPRARSRGAQLAFEEIGVEPEGRIAVEPARSTLDRIHQAMLLFGDGRSQALRWLLVDQGVGNDEQFWRLADALSKLYPPRSQEKRWVDGVLSRRKGLGL